MKVLVTQFRISDFGFRITMFFNPQSAIPNPQ